MVKLMCDALYGIFNERMPGYANESAWHTFILPL